MESLNINTIISLFTLFYVHYLQNCNSARCGALVTQDQCDKNPSCDWSDLADPPCFCAANAPLDIMFMIDESNSMKTEGFEAATNYTADMIRDGVSASSNIHIGKFSKKMRYAWQFWDPQGDLDMIEQAARDSPYEKQGNTRMC